MKRGGGGEDLYRVEVSPGINVPTFIPGGGSAWYKCEAITFILGGATTRYKCEAFVPGGEEETPTRSCERTFVPGGGSN
jgi:hypothetical protein